MDKHKETISVSMARQLLSVYLESEENFSTKERTEKRVSEEVSNFYPSTITGANGLEESIRVLAFQIRKQKCKTKGNKRKQ